MAKQKPKQWEDEPEYLTPLSLGSYVRYDGTAAQTKTAQIGFVKPKVKTAKRKGRITK